MQETMFSIPIPVLLALGFLIGIILLVLGYMEKTDPTRHQHLMGLGIIIIGIMIPITPLSWYGYLVLVRGLILGIIEIAIIALALIIGIVLLYIGSKTYMKSQ
jgi:hypothetical protein